ncbi:hypothetical protein D5086_004959 [Populus alba]|uniref:Uncharacterized protein n=1 Tax=Populus alba TaxID=43335 RepID=A0ACC4CT26_POPAL
MPSIDIHSLNVEKEYNGELNSKDDVGPAIRYAASFMAEALMIIMLQATSMKIGRNCQGIRYSNGTELTGQGFKFFPVEQKVMRALCFIKTLVVGDDKAVESERSVCL